MGIQTVCSEALFQNCLLSAPDHDAGNEFPVWKLSRPVGCWHRLQKPEAHVSWASALNLLCPHCSTVQVVSARRLPMMLLCLPAGRCNLPTPA